MIDIPDSAESSFFTVGVMEAIQQYRGKNIGVIGPSPEAHYPQAIEEFYAATKWVAAHGKEIDVDGSKLGIVGRPQRLATYANPGGRERYPARQGEAFGRKLELAGVRISTVRYNGMIHDWGMLNGLAQEPASKSVILHAAAQLRQCLE
jgi:acetyl esterase/lipase